MRRRLGYMCLAVTAALLLWFAQSPVSKADQFATSPILKDRHGALLNVRTVEEGTWRMAASLEDIDPAFILSLIHI